METPAQTLDSIERRIASAMQSERFRLRRTLRGIRRDFQNGKPIDERLARLVDKVEQSVQLREKRQKSVPRLSFPTDLPINEKRDEIGQAIQENQVVIVCGETGSGKSTQLPKICLEIGRGVSGRIGHTQPRRIAARSVAARIAEELKSKVGEHVGYKVRFTDTVKPATYIKLMTDGILLAETQGARFLDEYDTIILDEAHERSLNIDFLIGYLKQLLPKRRDFRLIITSATIDAERFANHFSSGRNAAPIIEVSGRTYPVETRYRPPATDDEGNASELLDSIALAVGELCQEGRGDILVFLPTEREIRETARRLRGWSIQSHVKPEILPLYARLATEQQNRIFHPGDRRRIVLATNVAESSLTVPRIHYVVDTGTARISRYSPRAKVQRLPIEPVSQASADQRQGRCGRIGPGICVRLYDEQDYLSRDRYTTPEIRRTNLASVILQMTALRLGDVDRFPFLDPPKTDAIQDGYRTLFELGAIDRQRELTETGRLMSRLPVDPRIARMILAADQHKCLAEVLIIASALELQDPRQRPPEKEQQADQQQAQFAHPESDFLSLLNLWNWSHKQKADVSKSKFRRLCQEHFLSWNRIREWEEIHRQLKQLVQNCGLRSEGRRDDYAAIHKALLTGLLSNVGTKASGHEYQGAGGTKSYLWPGSGIFESKPKWTVAAEVIETTRRYLRTVARIEPKWLVPLADHLVKRTYGKPRWSRKQSTVTAHETITLFGLTIESKRLTKYGKIDPDLSRHLFIQHALVEGDFDSSIEFYVRNRALIERLSHLAARTRNADYLISHADQYAFYEQRLPERLYDSQTLRQWQRRAPREQVDRLVMREEDLLPQLDTETVEEQFPRAIKAGTLSLDVDYRFEPGEARDGMNVTVPVEAVRQIDPAQLEWGAPGLLHEKLVALIKSLPKSVRRSLIPARDTATQAVKMMPFGAGPFAATLAAALSELAGEHVSPNDFDLTKLPQHLRVNLQVVDSSGELLAEGRDFEGVRKAIDSTPIVTNLGYKDERFDANGIKKWDFGELPEQVELSRGGVTIAAYPVLIDEQDSVGLQLIGDQQMALHRSRAGIRRLFVISERRELQAQVDWLPDLDKLELLASQLGQRRDFRSQLVDLLADRAFLREQSLPRNIDEFGAACTRGSERIAEAVQDITKLLAPILEKHQQVLLELEKWSSSSQLDAIEDVRQHLAELTVEGFLVETPWKWLTQFPRYLDGILSRLDKLTSGGGPRDAEALHELQPLLAAYQERKQQHEERGVFDPELEEYRWMLEELRVSFFAQQLGTIVKVSPRRLEKQWEKIRY